MKITVFGTGYVGLVTGSCLAEDGNHVLCVDIDPDKVADLKKGIIPIFEDGLETLVTRNSDAGRLEFTTSGAEGVEHADVIFIAVGTPADDSGAADLGSVLNVARTIGQHIREYTLIVTKSTVPVGTTENVRSTIREELNKRGRILDFDVASNPEFLKEGAAIADFMKPDRVVIGTDSPRATQVLRSIYASFNRSTDRIIEMDIRSSELTKYASNAMLATRISFINEMANLADRVGADIDSVRRGIGSDRRIGYDFIYPGCGFGGSCFPKDIQALSHTGRSVNYATPLVDTVMEVNERQKRILFKKILSHFDGRLAGKTLALWGLSFKPNTDDMRDAPSRDLMESLWAAGARVQAHDPAAMDECRRIYGQQNDLQLCESPHEALKNADALVVVTEWHLYRSPDFKLISSTLNEPVIFDGRNLYNPASMDEMGFAYYAIGRGKHQAYPSLAFTRPRMTGTYGGLEIIE